MYIATVDIQKIQFIIRRRFQGRAKVPRGRVFLTQFRLGMVKIIQPTRREIL